MFSKSILPLLLLTVVSISGCKEEEDNTPVTYPNYSQLKVGNYWIYQQFDVDINGVATPSNRFDSVFVEKDTLIRGNTYFKVFRPKVEVEFTSNYLYLRDSLHYTISDKGKIYFSSDNISTVLNESYHIVQVSSNPDTVCRIEERMVPTGFVINTPAGDFSPLQFNKTFHMFPNWNDAGTTREMNAYYVQDVGIVTETMQFYVSMPTYVERRLVRYHLN